MATYGAFSASTVSQTHPAATKNTPYLVNVVIDFATTTNATKDIFQAIVVPDNTAVLLAGIEVLTADTAGNSGTVALGLFSGIAAGGFVAAAIPTTVGQMVPVTVPASGFVLEGTGTVDSIDVTVATGAINAKIRVWAIMCDLTGYNSVQTGTFATTTTV